MTEDNSNWQKHPDLYMSDGTIVLLSGATLFRVYARLLAIRSVVFQDLFEPSHLSKDEEHVYDGCPLVKLQDDPEDLTYFLKATMNLCYFGKDQPMPYATASAIFRLSSKYMVQSLQQHVVKHLRDDNPQLYERFYEQVLKSTELGQ